jgi:hypothetical protein
MLQSLVLLFLLCALLSTAVESARKRKKVLEESVNNKVRGAIEEAMSAGLGNVRNSDPDTYYRFLNDKDAMKAKKQDLKAAKKRRSWN